jgi:hypothetical protein
MLANVGNLIIFLESISGTCLKVKLGVIYGPEGVHSKVDLVAMLLISYQKKKKKKEKRFCNFLW